MRGRSSSVARLRVLLMASVVAVVARPAAGQQQPGTTVAGGYSYLRDLDASGTAPADYPSGWFVSVTQKLGRQWAVTGEIDANSRTNVIEEQRIHAYLGGVEFPVASAWRMRVFTSVLAGVERFSEPGFDDSGFAFQPGLGVDVRLFRAISVRLDTAYRLVKEEHATFNELRIAAGAAIGFGR